MTELRSRKWTGLAIALLVVLAVARVASTWTIFSQTHDEAGHLASGFQWLSEGRCDVDVEHPPLARLFFALQPFLDGAHVNANEDRNAQGTALLERGGRYRRNLAGVRMGNVPFLVLALIAVALWGKRLAGSRGAILAVAFCGALPPLLAHAGLVTTDMAAAATTMTALYAFARWLDEPVWTHAAIAGLAIGIGLLSKFSFVVFFAAGAVIMLLAQWKRPRVRQAAVVASIAFVLVWAGYRFTAGTLNDARFVVFPEPFEEHTAAKYARVPGYEWVRADLLRSYTSYAFDVKRRKGAAFHGIDFVDWAKAAGYPSPLAGRWGFDSMANQPPLPPRSFGARCLEPFRAAKQWMVTHVPIPAPYFIVGIEYVARHSREGHPAFLLGHRSASGWWYYFPVVFFFKTPLPFVVLSLIGIVLLVRRGGEARGVALAPIAMMLVAMTSGINIGVRHILPIYPFLAIAAAIATIALWRHSRAIVAVLLAWFFIGTTVAHPDYLAWFNELAGRHPERIASDSNLD
ncbi:MAG TPA: glycosyltransferase family 39 protein, partial [Thermoanaerobaculia bacterium]|nr:glycosyltransferase family 39 protein [Thermoanaerobaculia bacterium]